MGAAAIVGLAISALGTGAAIHSAQEQKKEAKKQSREQKAQAALQARLQQAQVRRQARIRKAQLQVGAGAAGITGSIVEAPITGIETGAASQTGLIQEQLATQQRQFDIAASQTAAQANQQIAGALGSFAAQALPTIGGLFPETPTGGMQSKNPITGEITIG